MPIGMDADRDEVLTVLEERGTPDDLALASAMRRACAPRTLKARR